MSLYAGARLRSWQAYLLPLVILAVTDPILGMIFGFAAFTALTPFVYFGFILNLWIGRHLRHRERIWHIAGAASLCSLQFFLVTNFAEWATGRLYPHTLVGLVDCYVLAIPFFAWTLAGDLT
jgi:arginine exporter protein ArgO